MVRFGDRAVAVDDYPLEEAKDYPACWPRLNGLTPPKLAIFQLGEASRRVAQAGGVQAAASEPSPDSTETPSLPFISEQIPGASERVSLISPAPPSQSFHFA